METNNPFQPIRILVALAVLCAQMLLACAPIVQHQPTTGMTAPPVSHPAPASVALQLPLEEVIARAELIFIGDVAGRGEVVNNARLPTDPSKPDPNVYGIGQVYHVQVERYLKGDAGPTVDFLQSEGAIHGRDIPRTPENIEKARAVRHPLHAGEKYLFLLVPERVPEGKQYWSGLNYPGWYSLDGDGGAAMVSQVEKIIEEQKVRPYVRPTPVLPTPRPAVADQMNPAQHYRLREATSFWVKGAVKTGLIMDDPDLRDQLTQALDTLVGIERVPNGEFPPHDLRTILIVYDFDGRREGFHYRVDEGRIYHYLDMLVFDAPAEVVAILQPLFEEGRVLQPPPVETPTPGTGH